GDEVPRALKPPELIFTGSGSYEFLLSPGIGGEVSTFGACWVTYVDEERRPGAVLQMDASFTATENTFHQDSCSARTWNDAVMCPATTIYQGDELALYLASRYPARRIGIVDPDWNIYLLPAEKDPETGMPGIRIVAGSEAAQSYSYESAPDLLGRSVHVETKAGRVFTKSGWYIAVSVPGPQCDTTTDVGACWIHYVDRPHPR
ncbi:MAG TPA: hypothetical protein VEF03_00310, partial [Candidatus Binataceae bacterium]|nr:hypothetical protein [Candidatus Binataceae bacterium]